MRQLAALLFVALVVLAGCNAPFAAGNGSAGDDTTGATAPAPATATTGAGDTDATNGAATDTDEPAGTASTAEGTGEAAQNIADPAEDVLGWEGGYWYNESVPVTDADGLNATERRAVVNRTMARLERIRGLEFTESIPVEVVSREAYRQRAGGGGGDPSAAFRAFDNAKYEGLFLVGEDENSLAVQQSNRGQNVLGFYSPTENSIVIVSPTETPRLTRSTLAHELTHALQDQQFDLTSSVPATRDGANARNGVIEGEASYVERRYENRCGEEWSCLETPNATGGNTTSEFNQGVYILQYFPYADGPGFVDWVHDRRGWEGVNALHRDLPTSAEQVIYPAKYGNDTPTPVEIRGTNASDWTRVRPDSRPDYATLGQSGLSAMFGYTLYDRFNRSQAVDPAAFLNTEGAGRINRSDPFNYDLNVIDGWEGDRMHVYRNDDGETGYVWKLAWNSSTSAREFVTGYERLLAHWGGEPTDTEGVWRIEKGSPFADAFSIRRDGDTVTIVNAPTVEGLDAVHDDATDG